MARKLALLLLPVALCLAVVLLMRASDRLAERDTDATPVATRSRPDAAESPATVGRRERAPVTRSVPATNAVADTAVAMPPPMPDAIPGEAVLMFYTDAQLTAFLERAAAEGVEVIDRIGALRAVRVRVEDGGQLRRVLARSPVPIAHGDNFYVRRPPPPEPPEGVVYEAFGPAGAAWLGAVERDGWGQGITVAVLDTAVWAGLGGDTRRIIDLVNAPSIGAPAQHGSAVASIIVGGNERPGVAPEVGLLAVRVMGDGGVGDTFTLARGVIEAVNGGARVINMSVGSRGDTPVLREAIAWARREGAVIVAAAGNDGADGVLYPARYPGVLAVGAVDAAGQYVYFSNRGAALDLVAPGVGVSAEGAGGEAVAFSGTSAAAPFVAGAVAGVWSQWPALDGAAVAGLLVRYADDAGAPGRDPHYGAGVLNLERVLERGTPGLRDMALVRPHVKPHPLYSDELVVSLYAQNRGTEPLRRVVFKATVDGAPVDRVFYNVGVGALVRHDTRLTRAGVGERTITIEQEVSLEDGADRTPQNNRMRLMLSIH